MALEDENDDLHTSKEEKAFFNQVKKNRNKLKEAKLLFREVFEYLTDDTPYSKKLRSKINKFLTTD